MKNCKDKPINLRLSADMLTELNKLCSFYGDLSLSALIRMSLASFLLENKDKLK